MVTTPSTVNQKKIEGLTKKFSTHQIFVILIINARAKLERKFFLSVIIFVDATSDKN